MEITAEQRELLKRLEEEAAGVSEALESDDRQRLIKKLASVIRAVIALAEASEIHSLLEVFREVLNE